MTPPRAPSPNTLAPVEGAVADTTQRALLDLVAAIAALMPPGMLSALAAAAAGVVAETQRMEACAAEAATAQDRERNDEIVELRAAAKTAEAARDSERAARLAAEDAVRVLRARYMGLRRVIADIGARAATILAADAETPAAAQAPDDDDDGNDADGRERPAPPAMPQSGEDEEPVCRRDPPSGAAAVARRRDRFGDRAPHSGAPAPQ